MELNPSESYFRFRFGGILGSNSNHEGVGDRFEGEISGGMRCSRVVIPYSISL